MIELIARDNTYDTVYGIGYFGLGKLTGVQYDEGHDGNWWRQWFEKNKGRYPQLANATTPAPTPSPEKPALVKATMHDDGSEGDDVADVPSKTIRLNKDPNKRYFLIGPARAAKEPRDGYKLLLVLPGGDGSAEFHPFVKRIWKNALPDGYVVAQPIAPKWTDDENRVVWPTKGLKDEKAKFTTEEFVLSVIKDVSKRHKIDKKHVYALGWSSGGPPVYATAMMEASPLTGAFVAMSVYHPQTLPSPSNAKSRRFYLLHSPEDFIKMHFPETAKRVLSEGGAKVKLQTYEGGHGWRGDVFGMIRTGINWLEDTKSDT
jgi:predicted esterase